MSSTKILLILLIIVIVLFVVFVAWGAKKNSSEPAPTSDSFNSGKYPILSFNGVLARFGPKFEVNQLQPPVGTFDLQTQSQYSVKVLGDSMHKFRQAKFLVQPS